MKVEALYREYEKRILWKLNELENKKHVAICAGGKCFCRSRQQEIHEWEDWYLENGEKSMEEINWTIPRNVLLTVSLSTSKPSKESSEI